MSDEIAAVMAEQEARSQQAFLNSIRMRESQQADERMRLNAEIQREQMKALEDQRAAVADERKSRIAGNLAATLTPGAELDEAGTSALQAGGMGSLINQEAPTATAGAVSGLEAPTADNPIGLSTAAPTARVVAGRSLFKGTAKQNKESQDRAARLEWLKGQPDSPAKQMMIAQLMTGDSSLPITAFQDPNQPIMVVDPETGTVKNVGSAPRGARVVTAPRDRAPDKPGTPQVFYGEDGKPRAIQFMPDGSSREVQLPTGIASKVAPKKEETTQEVEDKAAARARGAAQGKKEVSGGGLLGSLWNRAFGGDKPAPVPAHGPATKPAPADQGGVEEWVRDASGKLVRKQ